jgi:hypothetical protein
MIREAQRAGLQFDETKLRALSCSPDEQEELASDRRMTAATLVPQISIDPASPRLEEPDCGQSSTPDETAAAGESAFHRVLHAAATRGTIHDVLQFKNGVANFGVVCWNIMEYLPFRRMDLQPDGSWKSISWPLPKGEVRDMPDDAIIHNSVIKRMEANSNYRPGNLICGGGGRGVRKAPEKLGTGKWKIHSEPGDPIGECYTRAEKPASKKSKSP